MWRAISSNWSYLTRKGGAERDYWSCVFPVWFCIRVRARWLTKRIQCLGLPEAIQVWYKASLSSFWHGSYIFRSEKKGIGEEYENERGRKIYAKLVELRSEAQDRGDPKIRLQLLLPMPLHVNEHWMGGPTMYTVLLTLLCRWKAYWTEHSQKYVKNFKCCTAFLLWIFMVIQYGMVVLSISIWLLIYQL